MFHKKFMFPDIKRHLGFLYGAPQFTIDETVQILINRDFNNQEAILKLQSELTAIHDHYRAELCGTCCHFNVCGIAQTIKYGDECAEHEFPCEFGITLCEVGPEQKESPPVVGSNQED